MAIKVGQIRNGKKLVGYDVFYAPDGCDIAYCGRYTNLRDARGVKSTGTPRHLWATGEAARDPNLMGPDKDGVEVDEEAFEWFGRDGYHCICCVWKPEAKEQDRQVDRSEYDCPC